MTVRDATLLHRGEHFRYVEDGEIYEGECVWAWTTSEPGTLPTRTWPLTIEVRSIHPVAPTRRARLGRDRQRAIAREVKRILEARDAGCEVLLFERAR